MGWQNLQEKLDELEEQLHSRFLADSPDHETRGASTALVRRQLPAVQKPPALPVLPQQLSWPFTPSPLQCGAEYRAALAAEESLKNEHPGAWSTEPTTLTDPCVDGASPASPPITTWNILPATPRQREWALLSGGTQSTTSNDQAMDSLAKIRQTMKG
eukprot:symbB.v1.2.018645.t1/scaffold1450.1/size158887/5